MKSFGSMRNWEIGSFKSSSQVGNFHGSWKSFQVLTRDFLFRQSKSYIGNQAPLKGWEPLSIRQSAGDFNTIWGVGGTHKCSRVFLVLLHKYLEFFKSVHFQIKSPLLDVLYVRYADPHAQFVHHQQYFVVTFP